MKLQFNDNGWDDYLWWQRQDRKILKRINELIADIDRNGAAEGIGKPEPLRHDYAGYFSRRITGEHRLIYRVDDQDVIHLIGCRYHYSR